MDEALKRDVGRKKTACNVDHLNENLGALNVHLRPADPGELETEFTKLKVHGGRMSEMQMKVVDQTV